MRTEERSARRLVPVHVSVSGLRLHGWHHPRPAGESRPAVVLVQGLGVSSGYLLPLARALATGSQVWVPDLPGHGESEHARRPLDVPGLAAVLLGWMDAVVLDRPMLVGQSLGCQVVAELAAHHPGRTAGLVLIAPTPDPRTRTPVHALLHLLRDVPRERISLIPTVVTDYLHAGPRLVAAEYSAMLHHDMAGALRRLRAHGVRCAVVRGERDPVVGGSWAGEVALLAGAPEPVTLRGCGHAVQYSAPGEVAAVVRGVLAG